MNSDKFLTIHPKLKWHANLLQVLDFVDTNKNRKNEYSFQLSEASKKLEIETATFKNYLRRLEKLGIIEWKRYAGMKGPTTVHVIQ